MAKASEIKVGNILRFNGELVTVTEVMHRTPGKGGAFYLDKFRNIKTGKIVEARLGTDELEVEICRVETNDFQYLYEDGDFMVIMDNTSFDQHNIPKALFGLCCEIPEGKGMSVIVSFLKVKNLLWRRHLTLLNLKLRMPNRRLKAIPLRARLKPRQQKME